MMFCIAFHFFPKPPRQTPTMALGKTGSRRDSFGLEVRADGTLTFDLSRENSQIMDAQPLTSSSQGARSRRGSDGRSSRPLLLRQAESDSWKSLGSLTKKRRRRDSFGLEVRADGTLSLDQVARAGGSPSPAPSRSETNVSARAVGRDGLSRANCDGGASRQSLLLSRTTTSQTRRRRDSFGLEVREDGTLSLDQLQEIGGDGGGREHDRSSRFPPTVGHTADSSNPTRRYNGPTRTINSGTGRRSIAGTHTSVTRGGGTQTTSANYSEVELLRARVRRLEAELAVCGRPPTRNSMDAPPAYQPRSGSPTREHI